MCSVRRALSRCLASRLTCPRTLRLVHPGIVTGHLFLLLLHLFPGLRLGAQLGSPAKDCGPSPTQQQPSTGDNKPTAPTASPQPLATPVGHTVSSPRRASTSRQPPATPSPPKPKQVNSPAPPSTPKASGRQRPVDSEAVSPIHLRSGRKLAMARQQPDQPRNIEPHHCPRPVQDQPPEPSSLKQQSARQHVSGVTSRPSDQGSADATPMEVVSGDDQDDAM